VKEWYPQYRERPYFVPPLHFNKTQYRQTMTSAGLAVYVTEPPAVQAQRQPRGAPIVLTTSDVRDDVAVVKVLQCLHKPELASEVMFVLSQLDFGDYLNKPCYAAAAALLPKPVQLSARKMERGDFDLLLLHKEHGVVAGEVKAVGQFSADMTHAEQLDAIATRVSKAACQLTKDKEVLAHVLSDVTPLPRIVATLLLPNVSDGQLQDMLRSHPALAMVSGVVGWWWWWWW
jgi:hypothetical protein